MVDATLYEKEMEEIEPKSDSWFVGKYTEFCKEKFPIEEDLVFANPICYTA